MNPATLIAIGMLFVSTTYSQAHSTTEPKIEIVVDISSKRMRVLVDNKERYTWSVAIVPGRSTRPGEFRVQFLSEDHYSSIYNNEPMPYSIFYDGNRAVHGTTKKIKGHQTHGCIALTRPNAQVLFELVSRNRKKTRIIVEQ